MNKRLVFVSVVAFTLFMGSVLALGAAGVDQDNKVITFAFCDALSGPAGAYGSGCLHGAEVAVAEINKQGGIGEGPLAGYTLKLEAFDDRGEAKEAASVGRQVASGEYLFVSGATISTAALGISPVLYRARVPYIMGWASASSLTHQGFDNLVRTTYTTEAEALAMLKTMQERFGVKKASVIVENGSYGQELLETMTANAADFGIELGKPLTIVPKQDVDFNAVLIKAQEETPDMLVILVERNEGGMIVSQARKLGWEVPVYGPKSLGEPQFFELAGKLGEVYLTCTPSLDTTGSYVQNFLANWGEVYDYAPDMAAIYGYDSVKIALKVIEMGGVDRESFIEKLREVEVEGIGNPLYSFDENGDVQVPNLITISGQEFKAEFLDKE